MSTEIRAVETDGASRIIQSISDVNSFNNDSMASLSDHKNYSKVPNLMFTDMDFAQEGKEKISATIAASMIEVMNGITIDKEEIKIEMPI